MQIESVILLWHVHDVGGNEDEKLIGVYGSEEDAIAAIERLKTKPGFAQTTEGFLYEKYELNVDHWTEGFTEARK
jgi:homoserine kinase type II